VLKTANFALAADAAKDAALLKRGVGLARLGAKRQRRMGFTLCPDRGALPALMLIP